MKFLLRTLCPCLLLLLVLKTASALPSQSSLRLRRNASEANHFRGIAPGYAERWFGNLRIPSFCRMNLCHGSCSDPNRSICAPSIMGFPSLYDPFERLADESRAPCTLRTFQNLLNTMRPSTCSHLQHTPVL
jgi:hypothetical protein